MNVALLVLAAAHPPVPEASGGEIPYGILGALGIVFALAIKEFFAYLKARDAKGDAGGSKAMTDMFALMRDMSDQIKDLHSWHDVRDEDGVPVWYLRRSLERQIMRLCEAVEGMGKASSGQTDAVEEALTAVLETLKDMKKQLGAVKKQLEEASDAG